MILKNKFVTNNFKQNNKMIIKINKIEYKVYFKYSEFAQTICAMHDKKGLSQTVVSHGTLRITEVILKNLTTDSEILRGTSECQIFDKYDKRFGMNLAVRNLLKDFISLMDVNDTEYLMILHQTIYETFFNFKKNIPYKYLVESK